MSVIRRWFSLRTAVDRRFYVLSGISLMALKYALDALLVWSVTGKWLAPLDYLNPVFAIRGRALGPVPDWLFATMGVWALPFLWIGLSMSVRRAVSAGRSPWYGLGFALPLFNYFLMLELSLRPEIGARAQHDAPLAEIANRRVSGALLGLAAGVGITLGMSLFSIYVLGMYGSTLFWTTPVAIGAAASFIFNRHALQSWRATLAVTFTALALGASCLLLFALEGALCLVMAFPLALVGATFGAGIAYRIAASSRSTGAGLALFVVLLPLSAGVERFPEGAVLHEVKSVIEVDAAAADVWPHVVGFSDLPEPDDWAFHTGVAYPLRATIQGRGVGAVRRCEFSTGPFVEPITAWEEPHRLAFDVSAQPPAMREWSPYRKVHPPHLDGYLRSRRGEFRLVSLARGRTRLEGSTWYELDLAPNFYFVAWSHWAIHRIHMRVLEHIKMEAEAKS